MNKQLYVLIGLGLLSTAILTSCQKEQLLQGAEETISLPEVDIYTATAEISPYTQPGQIDSRATVKDDGKTFYWEQNDQISIWDGKNAYLFKTKNYDGTGMFNFVEFTGEADLEDGANVSAVYPKRDNATADNIFVFTLAETADQNIDGKPHLAQTMHMKATGKVYDKSISQMKFQHLTSLFDFTIAGFEGKTVTIGKLEVTASAPVFPMKLTTVWAEGGDVYTYTEKKATLTLNMNNVVLDGTKELTGYMNFFPTQDMKTDTRLTFRALDEQGNEVARLEGVVSELYGDKLKESNYEAGKRYGVTLLAGGDASHVWVKDMETLKEAMASHAGTEGAIIKLAADVDMANSEWTPVAELKATLDGAGHTLKNFSSVNQNATGIGLFLTNSGTIKNLNLSSAVINLNGGKCIGLLAVDNQGYINHCSAVDSRITASGATDSKYIGVLVGKNLGEGTITDCSVNGVTNSIESNFNVGGLVGHNVGIIKGSSVQNANMTVGLNAGSNVAVFAGLSNNNGVLEGCSASNSSITVTNTTSFWVGGLVAGGWCESNFTSKITLSYVYNVRFGVNVNCSVGGLLGQGGGQGAKTVTSCYSLCSSPAADDQHFGQLIKNAVKVTASECYFVDRTACAVAQNYDGSLEGTTKLEDSNAIKAKAELMNTAAQNSDYQFVVNAGEGAPLLIVKK